MCEISFWIEGFYCLLSGSDYRVSVLSFRVSGVDFRGSVDRVLVFGFEVSGVVFRGLGVGFTEQAVPGRAGARREAGW